MAQQANLQAATRAETGKGAARTLRRQGKVPGVIYGHNRTPEAVAIDTAALNKMLVGISAGMQRLGPLADPAELFDADALPYLAEHAAQHMRERRPDEPGAFEFGLDLVLDGIGRMRDGG